MRHTQITRRLAGLGGAKWEVFYKAQEMAAQGREVIDLTIGEPDVPVPADLIEIAVEAMRRGRTGYSSGQGEAGLRDALAARYSVRCGRAILPDQLLCFPGTQTALFTVLMGVAEAGTEVLVGDPMYATYEGVIRASGADMVPVPLRPERGFCLDAGDIAQRLTPRSTAILLTTPHNPTGAVLSRQDIAAIGKLAQDNDLWIICDEVYEDLIFDDATFASPLDLPELAARTIVVSSISKSHAAPGFRSGWCVAPVPFCQGLLPLSETMLFGNQPFIADMTEQAIRVGSTVAPGMRRRFAARAEQLDKSLSQATRLRVHRPRAGMFAMIEISASAMTGRDYALHLLERTGVAVMPGTAFGKTIDPWVRVALTVEDAAFDLACERIVLHAQQVRAVTS